GAWPDGVERPFWAALAELGWLGVLAPEAAGGLGLGMPEMAALAEECGRALLAEPVLDVAGSAACLLVGLGPDPRVRGLLDGLVAGRTIPLLAWQCSPHAPFERAFGVSSTPR